MASKISSDERNEFSQRLNDALSAAGYPLSPTVLAREFNPRADGAAVTVHGARKWLMGEAIPTQDRIHVLSRWLGVAAQWLRYGDGGISDDAANDSMRLPLDDVMLLNDFHRLDERSQEVVRDVITSLLKYHVLRS